MKLTVTQLRQIIREVVTESVLGQPPLQWEEGEDSFGRKFYYSDKGIYDWSPSTGHLKFISNTNGRIQTLSKDLNPRRSGGFHDVKSEEQATERVRQHMARQKK
jgi:hypothetical protein